MGQESLFGILADHGYRLYSGTTVGKDDDSFAQFLQNCTGDRLDRLIGREELGPASRTKGAWGNDLPLVDDFCEWYARQSGHTAALLWFAGPHWPYGAVFEPFGEERLVDRYDNGVYSSDVALDRLWEGIGRTGRRPLLVVFGDHGQALLEHVGDRGPGQYLYEVSMHVPCVFLGEDLFPGRLDLDQRFQIKDLPATLLFLLGLGRPFRQSENIFARTSSDKIYMTNPNQDFKLGWLHGSEKFFFRTRRDITYVFDIEADPWETQNLLQTLSETEIRTRKDELLQYYFFQTSYLDHMFPH